MPRAARFAVLAVMAWLGSLPGMEPHPRRWWSGVLDVEQLAWTAAVAARDAARRVAERRRVDVPIDADVALTAAAFNAIEHLRINSTEPGGWAPMSGFFATRDGWVRTHANYPHHAAAITAALGATTRDDLTRVLAGMSALDVEDSVTAHRGIAVAVRTPEQWAAHPHDHATRAVPWSHTTVTGTTRPLNSADGEDVGLPLSGVHVLDLTRVIAGPTCSQLLACLGADVLRLDPPDRPELLEQYLSNGMGKRSTTADLAEPATRYALPGLLQACDVVLLGYRPGALARFGLDPDALNGRYPHLIVASLAVRLGRTRLLGPPARIRLHRPSRHRHRGPVRQRRPSRRAPGPGPPPRHWLPHGRRRPQPPRRR